MKINTEIHHVTKPGANLFLELGFAPTEAKHLQAASRKQTNDTQLLKQQLMEDVVNKKTAKLTIDTLVEMLSHVGKPVKLAIG